MTGTTQDGLPYFLTEFTGGEPSHSSWSGLRSWRRHRPIELWWKQQRPPTGKPLDRLMVPGPWRQLLWEPATKR